MFQNIQEEVENQTKEETKKETKTRKDILTNVISKKYILLYIIMYLYVRRQICIPPHAALSFVAAVPAVARHFARYKIAAGRLPLLGVERTVLVSEKYHQPGAQQRRYYADEPPFPAGVYEHEYRRRQQCRRRQRKNYSQYKVNLCFHMYIIRPLWQKSKQKGGTEANSVKNSQKSFGYIQIKFLQKNVA